MTNETTQENMEVADTALPEAHAISDAAKEAEVLYFQSEAEVGGTEAEVGDSVTVH